MKIFLILFLPLLFAHPAQAGGGPGGFVGATEITQYLNYGELFNQTNTVMSQLTTQISQLQAMQRQMERLGQVTDWTQASQVLGMVSRTVRQAQSIGYDSQVMARRWDTLYPCEFRFKLDTHSTAKWTAIPEQTGH